MLTKSKSFQMKTMKRPNESNPRLRSVGGHSTVRVSPVRAETKLILMAVSVLCSFAVITACSRMYVSADNSPAAAWHEFCGYVSDGDFKAAVEMTGNSIDTAPDDLDGSLEGLILTRLSEYFRADVISQPRINGTGAWQSVRIHHLDMSFVMKKALAGVMKETGDYEWNHGSYKTDGEISDAVKESLHNQLSGDLNDCLVTDVIKVEFRYKDGKWRPVMSDALYNALTGNTSGAYEGVEQFFEEYRELK